MNYIIKIACKKIEGRFSINAKNYMQYIIAYNYKVNIELNSYSFYMTTTQRILSFDIGIKNLAYCYFEKSNTETSYKILDWRVLNLMQSHIESTNPEPQQKCCQIIKDRKKGDHSCGKPAKYQSKEQTYCERHAKAQTDRIIPKKCHEPTWLNKQKKSVLEELVKTSCGGGDEVAVLGKNKADLIQYLVKYYQERSFQIIQSIGSGGAGVSAGDLDLITIGRNMISYLDEFRSKFDAPTHIIIENQISTIASRMKTIQGELTMYFLVHFPQVHIEYISSRNKLKMGGAESQEKSTYKKHKTDAVEYTKKILEEKPDLASSWLPYFLNERKKKDDLADCFLQGLWYLQKNKNINDSSNP